MDEHLLRYDKTKTFVFIDLETFNLCLNFCHNLPWQIGMIKAKGDFKTDSKNFYIKWDTDLKISEAAARITRYDHKKVTKEEYKKRVKKGWETRRKNLLNKLKDSNNNQENEAETINP